MQKWVRVKTRSKSSREAEQSIKPDRSGTGECASRALGKKTKTGENGNREFSDEPILVAEDGGIMC